MIPESCQAYSIRLYKASTFPTKWSFVKTLIYGNCFDSSVLYYNGKWWMFTSDRNDVLRLFYSANPMGPWEEHPESPIVVGDASMSRCRGKNRII